MPIAPIYPETYWSPTVTMCETLKKKEQLNKQRHTFYCLATAAGGAIVELSP